MADATSSTTQPMTAPPSPGRAGAPLPTPSIPSPSPLTPSTRRRIAASSAGATAVGSPARTPNGSRRLSGSSGSAPGGTRTPLAERRKRAEAERIRNLKGWAWAMHRLNQQRAMLTLTVWLSNLYAFMTGYGRFKVRGGLLWGW